MDPMATSMAFQAQADDGLTFREIVQSLPTDPASLFVLIVMIALIGVIVYFGMVSSARNETIGGGKTGPALPRSRRARPKAGL